MLVSDGHFIFKFRVRSLPMIGKKRNELLDKILMLRFDPEMNEDFKKNSRDSKNRKLLWIKITEKIENVNDPLVVQNIFNNFMKNVRKKTKEIKLGMSCKKWIYYDLAKKYMSYLIESSEQFGKETMEKNKTEKIPFDVPDTGTNKSEESIMSGTNTTKNTTGTNTSILSSTHNEENPETHEEMKFDTIKVELQEDTANVPDLDTSSSISLKQHDDRKKTSCILKNMIKTDETSVLTFLNPGESKILNLTNERDALIKQLLLSQEVCESLIREITKKNSMIQGLLGDRNERMILISRVKERLF